MPPRVPPHLVMLFGSETRVRVLATLAGAYGPMTAYRVAKVGGTPISKAYEEIQRLASAHIVVKRGTGWVLRDTDIRLLLRRKVPIVWWTDWWAEKERRSSRSQDIVRRSLASPLSPAPKGWKPRTHMHRDPKKDQVLLKAGLRPSVHG